jgi:hypothetical protein
MLQIRGLIVTTGGKPLTTIKYAFLAWVFGYCVLCSAPAIAKSMKMGRVRREREGLSRFDLSDGLAAPFSTFHMTTARIT